MKLNDITKIYHNKNNDVVALNHISLDIPNSGLTGILGPSGCGKTTLLNIITGIDNDYTGTIEFNGKVELIPQEIELFENMTILDNLLLVSSDKEKIHHLLEQFELPNHKKIVKSLSIGEKKRVQIIRSMLVNCSLIVCDEPTAALDNENTAKIMNLLKMISSQIPVIIVTHYVELVDLYADHIIKMGKGCILESKIANTNASSISIQNNSKKASKYFVFKSFISRPLEHTLQFFLIFTLSLIFFVLLSLFPSVNSTSKGYSNWLKSNNLIITNPISEDTSGKPSTSENNYFEYDLYKKDDVYLVNDSLDSIIAYQIGWDIYKYAIVSPGSFMPEITVGEYNKKLEALYPKYQKNNINPIPFFIDAYTGYKDADQNAVVIDYSNYEGIKFDDTNGLHCNRHEPHLENVFIGNSQLKIAPYQLFDDKNIEVNIGTRPTSNHDILLAKNVAEELVREYDLNNLDELIGRQIPIQLEKCVITKVTQEYEIREYMFTVSGITYLQSDYEMQVFFADGGFESCVVDLYEYDPEVATYQYIHFLIDPTKDPLTVANKINDILNSQKSRFIQYSSTLIGDESYQSTSTIVIYTLLGMLVTSVLYVLTPLLHNSRIKKENKILRQYDYHPMLIQLIKCFVLLIIVGVLQMSNLPIICDFINNAFNSLGIPSSIVITSIQYLFIFIATTLFIMLLETLLHVYRTKKS